MLSRTAIPAVLLSRASIISVLLGRASVRCVLLSSTTVVRALLSGTYIGVSVSISHRRGPIHGRIRQALRGILVAERGRVADLARGRRHGGVDGRGPLLGGSRRRRIPIGAVRRVLGSGSRNSPPLGPGVEAGLVVRRGGTALWGEHVSSAGRIARGRLRGARAVVVVVVPLSLGLSVLSSTVLRRRGAVGWGVRRRRVVGVVAHGSVAGCCCRTESLQHGPLYIMKLGISRMDVSVAPCCETKH